MKAVILAAGRGTRMGALTEELPKPLLEARGKTLLHHKLDELPDCVDEIVLVVGYHGPKIRERIGDAHGERMVTYVTQETLDGTAGALWQASEFLTERFLVMMGDDIYTKQDAEHCLTTDGWTLLVQETDGPGEAGSILTENGRMTAIREGRFEGPALICTNLFALDSRIFEYPLVPKAPGSSEYGLPQTVLAASLASGIPLNTVSTKEWIQVTAPEDLRF